MFKKLVVTGLMALIVGAANASILAHSNDNDKEQKTVTAAKQLKDWKTIVNENRTKAFDPSSQKSTMADHNQTKKAGRKFSTTSKVLIGVGIAAAVLAVVFVVARKDLKDDVLR